MSTTTAPTRAAFLNRLRELMDIDPAIESALRRMERMASRVDLTSTQWGFQLRDLDTFESLHSVGAEREAGDILADVRALLRGVSA